MKIQGFIFWLIIAGLFVANGVWWHGNWFKFSGYMLIGIIVFGFLLSIFFKITGKGNEEDAFILPNSMARAMKAVEMKTQYEATILSLFFMIVGGTCFLIYYVFLYDAAWGMKGLVIFNMFFGVILMVSMLATNYQQYVIFMQANRPLIEMLKNNSQELMSKNDPVATAASHVNNQKGGNL